MDSEIFTSNPSQTKRAGRLLAGQILKNKSGKKASILGLVGDLGGGKTTFLQGFAKGLGIKEKITSPTFVILKKFQISKLKTFYHIDCYRIKKPEELLDLNFKKIISSPPNIIAIEWADKIRKIMPKETIWINFDFIDNKTRKIMLQ